MNVTGIGPLPWRLQPEDAEPPELCEVVDATGAAVPFLSDFELDEVELATAIEALLRVVNHYPDLLAAARAVVEARAKLSFEMEPVEWTDQVFAVLLSIDALRAAIEAAGREEE